MAKLGLSAVLVLCAGAASAAALPSAPPLGPEGESAAANPAGDGVNDCLKYLGLITTRLHDHVDRTLISANQRWGLVLRADVSAPGDGAKVSWRFVCPVSAHGPVVLSAELNLPPLSSGPWGQVTTFK